MDETFGDRLSEQEKQKIADFTGKQIGLGLGFRLKSGSESAKQDLESLVREALKKADKETQNLFKKLEDLKNEMEKEKNPCKR